MTSVLGRETARPITPHSILVAQLQQTLKLAEESNIPIEILDSLRQGVELAAGLDPYLDDYTTPESSALRALAQRTSIEDWSKRFSDGETVRQLEQEMLSGHLEGQTLKMFVHMTKAKRILEVGMFTGYSALAMAEALPSDGQLIGCEVDSYVAQFAQACFSESAHGNKIVVEVAPALETLHKLAARKESFDLIFIDADKKEYVEYFQTILDSDLLAPDGLICVDNTLLQGQVYLPPQQRTANGEAIAQFNRAVAADPRVEQVLLPIRDGITLIRRMT
ncbi:O-methyltransferase [Nostoc sp. 'Peltigera membranacea cyanobiont' 232]|uniref:O-methyltransferase n=1 Tax=Nostoc sp. 'Peltigera membranacea cyanobiont' 232 TaxID=2014531 RepID=UPI000B950965|nr:class I SAM-dependent methyltransferase [Nostoc sp. 'Peltigera membranacea cyanobiont' 232]OYE01831.1 SAM-dependent methyltransferase [Nostoc sp. 'Peltigera membranacea cyanobiont' 232]